MMRLSFFQSLVFRSLIVGVISSFSFAKETNTQSSPLGLSELLKMAQDQSSELKAIELQIESARAEIKARDLSLSANLSARVFSLRDERETTAPNPENESTGFSTEVTQPFSSGTLLRLSLDSADSQRRNDPSKLNSSYWELGVTQSLWRDFFGRQTRYRREGDQKELEGRLAALRAEQQNFYIGLEQAYWDLLLSLLELQVRKENLDRSKQIERWVSVRLNRSAAERIDLLQARASVATRELQISVLENRLSTVWNQLRQVLPELPEKADWNVKKEELMEDRTAPNDLANVSSDAPVTWQALAQAAEAESKQSRFREVEEQLKPDLSFELAYGRNGRDSSMGEAWSESIEEDQYYRRVGLVFQTQLDFGLKRERKNAALLSSQAAKRRSDLALEAARIEWLDLIRERQTITERIDFARRVFELQRDKSSEERRRYQQGRSTAFQAITFEQEAAEAELLLYQLHNQKQKLNSRTRLFTLKGAAQ